MTEDRTRSVVPRAADPSAGLRLIVFCGGQVSSHALPRSGEVVLGRGEDAGIRIDHVTVSRRHATLQMGEQLTVVDHGSFNGTSIGGKKLPPHVPVPVGIATILELGETMAVVQVEGGEKVTGSRGLSQQAPRPELSPGMQHLLRMVDNVAQSNITVIVRGETGTGKEVIARTIHRRSPRAGGPFLRVNCGALPQDLIDSELFGHQRGSFTGAVADHRGWFERADGGTLLLDEVGELTPAAQVRLLRVLQDGTFQRVGGQRTLTVDVRVIAATNQDLRAMVATGAFREDLWYRIAVFPIRLPALRERPLDIPAMATHFALRAAERLSLAPQVPSAEDLDLLSAYAWPGNIRELASVIERAAILGNGQHLEVAQALGGSDLGPYAAGEGPAHTRSAHEEVEPLDAVMRRHIESALMRSHGRIEGPFGAANALGINPHTLRARMRKLRIDWRAFRRSSARRSTP